MITFAFDIIKIRQGLELALLDIDFVKHVEFVMDN